MIDWYLLLFIAFTLVMITIEKTGNHRNSHDYVVLSKYRGLSEGTYSLLIQFLTGATFLLPLFLTESFRFSSVLVIIFGALFVYSLLVKIMDNEEIKNSILFPMQDSTKSAPRSLFLLVLAFSNLGSIFIQTSIVAFLFQDLFQQSSFLGLSLFLAFCFLYFGLGGIYGVYRIGSILLYLSFFILSFTTLTLFLQSGIGTIFTQYQSHFSSLLDGSILEVLFCFFTFILVMIGHLCTSYYFWQSVHLVKENHRRSALRYSLFSWGALLMAFVLLTIFLLVQTNTPNLSGLLASVSLMEPFLLLVITFLVVTLLAVGVGHNLYSIISLFLMFRSQQNQKESYHLVKQAYLVGMVVCLVIGVASARFYENLSAWLPYFISFFASAGVPFLLVYFTGKFRKQTAFYTIVIMLIMAIVYIQFLPNIWVIAPVSCVIAFIIHLLIQRFKIIRNYIK
jgi:hypothetical protein